MSGSSPVDREAAARRRSAPVLDRASGVIRFADHAPAVRAASLAWFLFSRGVRVRAADEQAVHAVIQLLGVPDLDRVERLIGEWLTGANAEPDDEGPAPSGRHTRGKGDGDTGHGGAG